MKIDKSNLIAFFVMSDMKYFVLNSFLVSLWTVLYQTEGALGKGVETEELPCLLLHIWPVSRFKCLFWRQLYLITITCNQLDFLYRATLYSYFKSLRKKWCRVKMQQNPVFSANFLQISL